MLDTGWRPRPISDSGAKIKFWPRTTPRARYHTLYRLEDIDSFPEYEVDADAFAALTLHRIGMIKPRILDHGYILPMITARGPLCTMAVRGTTHFMIDIVDEARTASSTWYARGHRAG